MKIAKNDNFRVEIYPKMYFYNKKDITDQEYMNKCHSIISDINRHCDDILSIDIQYDTNTTCSFCGYTWEVDETGMPQCCTKAQAEFNSLNKPSHDLAIMEEF